MIGTYQKLFNVLSAIDVVEKKGHNEFSDYKYQRAVDVVSAVRKQLIAQRLFIVPSVIAATRYVNDSGKQRNGIILEMGFTVVDLDAPQPLNPEGHVFFRGAGEGVDSGDKAIYKAFTGALKYGLRGLFLILDSRDDPEYDQDTPPASQDDQGEADDGSEGVEAPMGSSALPEADRLKLFKIAQAAHPEMDKDDVIAMVVKEAKAMGLTSTENLTREQFDKLCDKFSGQKKTRKKK